MSIDAPRLIREANHDNVFKSSSVINPLTRACLTVILCANEKIPALDHSTNAAKQIYGKLYNDSRSELE